MTEHEVSRVARAIDKSLHDGVRRKPDRVRVSADPKLADPGVQR
jgi:hypothetical protein